jgi:hypothetical protein
MNSKTAIRWGAVLAIAIWLMGAIYIEFIDDDPLQYGITSSLAQQQMANCGGSYAQRSACKERILDQNQRSTFSTVWLLKVAIVFGPPALLWYLIVRLQRQPAPPPKKRKPAQRSEPEID